MRVKAPSMETETYTLSGGNQQKVVLAKWMMANPKIFIMDEPTRGIDVGAKFEIYNIMNEVLSQDMSIIFISSELPELLGMCDRIYVVCEGRISGELKREEFSQERVMNYATGGN
jgi:ABC-type sugar transport system ATPase subunit